MQFLQQVHSQINETGAKIAALQQRQKTVAREISGAWVHANRIGENLKLYQLQYGRDDRRTLELQKQHEEAERAARAKQQTGSDLELQLEEAHDEINALHRRRRERLALGGRDLPPVTPLPDPLEGDRELAALEKLAGELRSKLAGVHDALKTANAQADDTTGRLSVARVDFHRGLVKAGQLAELSAAAERHSATASRLDEEARSIAAALAAVETDVRDRTELLHARLLPAVRAEEKRRLTALVEKLRDAAIAAEACYPVAAALRELGAEPRAYAWEELRVRGAANGESKFMRWMLEVVEAGAID